MQKRILIVEDNEVFRETISEVLAEKYHITQAENGKVATEVMSLSDYDLVISDVQMPALSGIELLEWSRKNKPVPFIIMTGFSTLLETRSAYELGASGFLTKPFKINELQSCIADVLKDNHVEPPKPTLTSEDFCRVSIDEFFTKPVLEFDIYIKLSDKNFVKIANKNEELPRDQISTYKGRGIKYLHILKSEFRKLVQLNLELIKVVKGREGVPMDKKLQIIKGAGNLVLESSYTREISKDVLQDSNEFLQLSVECLTDSDEGFHLLDILSQHSNKVYAHSLVVSLYAVMIAKQLGITSSMTLLRIATAGMLHDIGKKEIDQTLLDKPRHLMTQEERALVESHVERGYSILVSVKNMHSDISRMVLEHHEDQSGMGYPLRKHAREQHPLSKILQCANLFVDNLELNMNGSNENAREHAIGAISHIEQIYGQRVDKFCLLALKKIFKMDLI